MGPYRSGTTPEKVHTTDKNRLFPAVLRLLQSFGDIDGGKELPRTATLDKLHGLIGQFENFSVQGGEKQGLAVGGDLPAVRIPAQVEIHMVGGFPLGEIQVDPDGDFILQPHRGEKLGIHIDHGNQVLFGKPFDVLEGEQLPGLGAPLQIVQVIDDAEHVRIANGDDFVMNERLHLSSIL